MWPPCHADAPIQHIPPFHHPPSIHYTSCDIQTTRAMIRHSTDKQRDVIYLSIDFHWTTTITSWLFIFIILAGCWYDEFCDMIAESKERKKVSRIFSRTGNKRAHRLLVYYIQMTRRHSPKQKDEFANHVLLGSSIRCVRIHQWLPQRRRRRRRPRQATTTCDLRARKTTALYANKATRV